MKALIVYGTRGGATQKIADEIGKVFGEQGMAVTVRNAKDTRGLDVKSFDLVVVGSSMWAMMWKRQATGFLKKHKRVLAGKKVALFASGLAGNDPAQADDANLSIAKVAAKFPEIKPVGLAFFGGYLDFNSSNFFVKMVSGAMKKDFESKGKDTSKPFDGRDWAAIRQWAADVAAKSR